MPFPDISAFEPVHPNPYERQMGGFIVGLLRLFRGRVPDTESNARVFELAVNQERWSAGHAVFDEVRKRLLATKGARGDAKRAQYFFEESCCQAIYNAINPPDPFSESSAFFVAGQAISLARAVGVSLESVADVLAGTAENLP